MKKKKKKNEQISSCINFAFRLTGLWTMSKFGFLSHYLFSNKKIDSKKKKKKIKKKKKYKI